MKRLAAMTQVLLVDDDVELGEMLVSKQELSEQGLGRPLARYDRGIDEASQRHPPPPSPLLPISIGILASLGFSALLAWYLAKPIRHLRGASDAAAAGKLGTRIGPRMGRRRDEIADLGRDCDRMAGQLQILVGSQRRLLHDVSHELRSPLARLQAAIGLARQ